MLKVWYARFDIPFDKDNSYRFISWVIGLMIFLATIALVMAVTVGSIVKKWDETFNNDFIVELPNIDLTHPQYIALDAKRQRAAVKILQDTVGVANAEIIFKTSISTFLAPELKTKSLDPVLPALINVEVRDGYKIDLEQLSLKLNQAVSGTVIRDHKEDHLRSIQFAHTLIWSSIVIASLIALAAILTISFMTYTGTEIHRHIIEVLHLIGAPNHYIARQFQEHALELALKGGLLGMALSVTVLGSLGYFLNKLQIFSIGEGMPKGQICIIIILTPLIGLILTALSARLTVISNLTKNASV